MPADVDLRDFAFMPLDVRRFRDSRLVATKNPEEVLACVLLWSASWHQEPASSLPDDEMELAQLAGYGRAVRDYRKVKSGSLYGFVLCSDGRWYHPVVAEKAAEGWNGKLEQEHKRATDRQRKSNKERQEQKLDPLPLPPRPLLLSMHKVNGIPQWRYRNSDGTQKNSGGNPDDDPWKSWLKGEVQGEGEGHTQSAGGGKPPNGVRVDPEQLACGRLSAALRSAGVTVQAHNPDLQAWVKAGVTEQIALEAVEVARKSKPKPQEIPARYLDRVIRSMLQPSTPVARAADPWAGAK